MGAFKIDRGIPFPGPQKAKAGRPPSYPIKDLAVGDSFFVESNKRVVSAEKGLMAAIHRGRHTFLLNIQAVPAVQDGKKGFRVFRVEDDVEADQTAKQGAGVLRSQRG